MVISFRGYVVCIGKDKNKVSESLTAVSAAKHTLMRMGKTESEADEHIKRMVDIILGMPHEE